MFECMGKYGGLTKIEVESLSGDMMPQPPRLFPEILQLLQPLVDQTNLVLLKVVFAHVLKLFLQEAVQEAVNALFQKLAILFALDDDPERLGCVECKRAATHNISELLLGAQSVKDWLVQDLTHQKQLSTKSAVVARAGEHHILDAVVDVIWVLQRTSIAEVAARRDEHGTLSWPLTRR